MKKNEKVSSLRFLQEQVEHYKKESDILLTLSNDITGVRKKNDLIKLFYPVLGSRLTKKLAYQNPEEINKMDL